MVPIETTPVDTASDMQHWVFWIAGAMIVWPPLQTAIDLAWQAHYMMDSYALFPLQLFRRQLEENYRQGLYTATIWSLLCLATAAFILLFSHRRWRAGLWLSCAIAWAPMLIAIGEELWSIRGAHLHGYAFWQWYESAMRSSLFFCLGFTAFISVILSPQTQADAAARTVLPPTWTVIFCCYLLLCIGVLYFVFWPHDWRDDPGANPQLRIIFAAISAVIAVSVIFFRRRASVRIGVAFLWLCATAYVCMLVFDWNNVPYEVDGLALISQEFGITVLAAAVWTAYLHTSGKVALHFSTSDTILAAHGVRPSDL